MNNNDQAKKEKCYCGRPVATEKESKAAHDKGQCEGCYEIDQYALLLELRRKNAEAKGA